MKNKNAILIGSHNPHKIKEISNLLNEIPVRIKSLLDYPEMKPVKETGQTLEANALLKAKSYARYTGLFTVADDTGLEVAALNGAPGVKSARYAGKNCSFQDNNAKLLRALKNNLHASARKAKFRTVIACYDPATRAATLVQGFILGRIATELRGSQGFGYDPVFYFPKLKKTLAEMTLLEKNSVSHRFQAIAKAKRIIKKYVKNTDL